MELLKLIIDYVLLGYYHYVMSIKGIVGLFLPEIAIPLVTGILVMLIPIAFLGRRVFGGTFLNLLFNKGLIVFSFIMAIGWVYATNDAALGFDTRKGISAIKSGLLLSGLPILALIQLNGQISIISRGIKRSKE